MPRGYWIAHIDVSDPEGYKSYISANAIALARFGGKFLVRGGKSETVEGQARSRHVVIEFPSYEDALACYRSPEYAEALAHRLDASEGDVILVEGYEGSQPEAR